MLNVGESRGILSISPVHAKTVCRLRLTWRYQVPKTIMTLTVQYANGRRVLFAVNPSDPDLMVVLTGSETGDLICAIPDDPEEDTACVDAVRRLCERDHLSSELCYLKLDPELFQFLEDRGSKTVFDVVSGSDTWWREQGATEAQLAAMQELLCSINEQYFTRLQLGMDLSAYRQPI
jgi:hypothetical protein